MFSMTRIRFWYTSLFRAFQKNSIHYVLLVLVYISVSSKIVEKDNSRQIYVIYCPFNVVTFSLFFIVFVFLFVFIFVPKR